MFGEKTLKSDNVNYRIPHRAFEYTAEYMIYP